MVLLFHRSDRNRYYRYRYVTLFISVRTDRLKSHRAVDRAFTESLRLIIIILRASIIEGLIYNSIQSTAHLCYRYAQCISAEGSEKRTVHCWALLIRTRTLESNLLSIMQHPTTNPISISTRFQWVWEPTTEAIEASVAVSIELCSSRWDPWTSCHESDLWP